MKQILFYFFFSFLGKKILFSKKKKKKVEKKNFQKKNWKFCAREIENISLVAKFSIHNRRWVNLVYKYILYF